MGKYIKYYDAHFEYDVEKDLLDEPNVAWCEQEEDVHYGPEIDYSQDYLTFEIINSGTLIWRRYIVNHHPTQCKINYSIDNGTTWTEISPVSSDDNTPFLNVTSGQKILVKGNNSKYFDEYGRGSDYESVYHNFGGTATFNAYGNIMSLVGGDNFQSITTFDAYAFYSLFAESNIISAKNLVLPVTTLVNSCYDKMFYNCTSLTVSPKLPATTLANSCYQHMFNGCTNLKYIKAMFTTTPNSNYTYNWVNNVASSGTFVKNSAAQWNVTGTNGIPSGWTVVTADS